MNRKLGSIVSTVALLAVAAGAAAVNVKILHSNRSDNSVLTVQQAADVVPLPSTTTAAEPAASPAPAETNAPSPASSEPAPVTTTTADPVPVAPAPKHSKSGKQIVGSVGGGGGHGEGDGEDGEGEGDDDHGARGGFVMLSPEQKALLRVAAIAQVKPGQARDAARGIGSTAVVNRVKAAANQVGVALTDLAAIKDLPPARGPGHGGEEHEGESDD